MQLLILRLLLSFHRDDVFLLIDGTFIHKICKWKYKCQSLMNLFDYIKSYYVTVSMPLLSDDVNSIQFKLKLHQNQNRSMSKVSLGFLLLGSLHCFILIPIYVALSPLCMISSGLFEWTMSWIIDDQTVTLILILALEWTVSAVLVFQLIRSRTGKSIFFYEFVFFLTCTNFVLIGVTYTLLRRFNIYEQTAAKICSSMLMILIAQKLKKKLFDHTQLPSCAICFEGLREDDSLLLKCKHIYHQKCIWDWIYVKPACPICKSKI